MDLNRPEDKELTTFTLYKCNNAEIRRNASYT